MYSDEEAEILQVLLKDLQDAFNHKKASRALTHAQNAYMRAARNLADLERYRHSKMPILGSEEKN